MRVLFTCGGTAGYVNPAVVLAQTFQTRNSGYEVLFVDANDGMEARLVPEEGYPAKAVTITNLRRSLSPASIGHNVGALLNMNKSRKQANAILNHFRPDLVVGIGGYASLPVVKTTVKRGTSTVVHEPNAVPGLTTRTLSKVVDVMMVSSEEGRGHYDDPEKVVVTGTPVCTDSFRYIWKGARVELGLTDDRLLVFSARGSPGAEVMNCQMAECTVLECRDGAPFHHVHDTSQDYRAVLGALQGNGLADHPEVDVREYVYDVPLAMVVTDLVLCRAGTSAVAEIATIAKPAVLVPSPNVVADHQAKDAGMLINANGAVLLPEGEPSREKLYALMTRLLSDTPWREAMSRALRDTVVPDTAEQIYQTLVRLMEKRAN